MKNSVFSQKIYSFLLAAYRWYLQTPERSLHEAYDAALKIKEIEDKHFYGKKIDIDSAIYSNSVMDYFESDLNKLLKTAKMRLTEFRASRWFLDEENQKAAQKAGIEHPSPALVLEKLNFIDQVTSKYTTISECSSILQRYHPKYQFKTRIKNQNQSVKPIQWAFYPALF